MLENNPLQPAPAASAESADSAAGQDNPDLSDEQKTSRFLLFWEELRQAGLAETALRLGTHALLLALILTTQRRQPSHRY